MKRILNLNKALIIILLVPIFLFNNCDEKVNCPPGGNEKLYYHLSKDTLNIPYTGFDTLSFLKQTFTDTDTVIFIGQGKKYYTILDWNDDMLPCPEEFVNDAYEIKFIDNKNSDSFLVKLYSSKDLEKFEFFYNERHFIGYLDDISNSFVKPFFNFINFNGVPYLRVSAYIPINSRGFYDFSRYDTLYLNKYCGIVRFAFDSSQYSLTYLK